jgi:uncharacterized FlaG/YvyC family protein
MVGNVDPVTTNAVVNQSVQKTDFQGDTVAKATEEQVAGTGISVSMKELVVAASEVSAVVNEVAPTSLSFSIEEDLSRMVVAVRAVGSDEIIRQFPPEEFLTVAKFIAAQNPDEMSEDFLKGILFDKHT